MTTHSEEGREVPEVVLRAVPATKLAIYLGNFESYDIEEVYPACDILKQGADLMTVAQHSRIVAAKDAELKELRDSMAFRTSLIGRLESELEQLRAQPARQAGGDERAKFNAWNNGTDCPLAGRDTKTGAWMAWKARAALAPVAVVMPGRKEVPAPNSWMRQGWAKGWNSACDEFSRLHRREIPAGLLERIAKIPLGIQGLLDHASAMDELRALLGEGVQDAQR